MASPRRRCTRSGGEGDRSSRKEGLPVQGPGSAEPVWAGELGEGSVQRTGIGCLVLGRQGKGQVGQTCPGAGVRTGRTEACGTRRSDTGAEGPVTLRLPFGLDAADGQVPSSLLDCSSSEITMALTQVTRWHFRGKVSATQEAELPFQRHLRLRSFHDVADSRGRRKR